VSETGGGGWVAGVFVAQIVAAVRTLETIRSLVQLRAEYRHRRKGLIVAWWLLRTHNSARTSASLRPPGFDDLQR